MTRKISYIAMFITAIIFVTGCTSNHTYKRQIMVLEAQLAEAKKAQTNPEGEEGKKDAPVIAGEEKKTHNDGAVAVADEKKATKAKAIPVAAMKKGKKKMTSQEKGKTAPKKAVKKSQKKTTRSWTNRIETLEKKVARHDRQIGELQRVMNEIAWDVAKQGGMENTKGFKIGPFKGGSAKLTKAMTHEVIGICAEYKKEIKAAEAQGIVKVVHISVETFTDTEGSEESNKKLAQGRATAIETVLKKELSGVLYNITLIPKGETETGYTKANARRAMIRHEFKEPGKKVPTAPKKP